MTPSLITYRQAIPTVLATVVFASSCGSDGDGPAVFDTRDSAGITIAENADYDPERIPTWQVSAEPTLRIGTVDGLDEYTFTNVRGAYRLSDRGVAAADRFEVRFYDSTGTFLHSVGRAGEGPGEFRVISNMWRLGGDSLLAWDFGLLRTTTISPGGSILEMQNIPPAPGFFYVLGAFGDRSLFVRFDGAFDLPAARNGVHEFNMPYARWDPVAERLDTVVHLYGGQTLVTNLRGRKMSTSVEFAARPQQAASLSSFFYGDARSFEVREYSLSGDLVRIVRLNRPLNPLTQRVIDSIYQSKLHSARDAAARRSISDRHDAMIYSDVLPAYSGLEVDDDGNLWVEEYSLDRARSDWLVFSPEGRLIASVRTPERFTITHFGSDELLGVWQDDLNVQYVTSYSLIKGPEESQGGI